MPTVTSVGSWGENWTQEGGSGGCVVCVEGVGCMVGAFAIVGLWRVVMLLEWGLGGEINSKDYQFGVTNIWNTTGKKKENIQSIPKLSSITQGFNVRLSTLGHGDNTSSTNWNSNLPTT